MADLSKLEGIVGAEQVLTGDAISDDYTHDEALTATPRRPLAVVRPASTAEVADLLTWATEQQVPVTARG
jgi:glycolate oxidase